MLQASDSLSEPSETQWKTHNLKKKKMIFICRQNTIVKVLYVFEYHIKINKNIATVHKKSWIIAF